MLRSLVAGSLHNRFLIVLLAAALLGGGVLSALRSPLDVFPEFAPPLVEVQVEAPGMSSEAVEQLVTIPLESALNGLPQMTTLRSKSVQGLSSVQMLFEPGSDVFRARQMVSERVAVEATRLPQLARAPHILPPLSSTSRVLKLGLTPKKGHVPPLDQTDVSVAMKWIIEPRIRAVAGVANVSTYGLHDRQYQILVKPADLRDHGLTLDQVRQGTKQAVVYGSAGFHDTPNQRLAIQHQTRVERFEDLGRTVIAHRKGEPILLGQIATLTTGNPPHIGEGVVNDEPGLLVVVEKFPWANTLEVTRDVEAAVEALKPSVPGVEIATRIFRPASFIELALANLRVAVLIGCGLVAAIVVAFLWEWRTAAISLTAIPLSLLGAVFVLERLGGTLNTMVLAGLAIAVGEVVDDAIIDVENIVRRLRQNPAGKSAFQVILDASIEVRSAVVFASAVVVFVCLPIFFLGGVAGAFFRPLAIAYILAVAVSLVIALTLTPALAYLLLPGHLGSERGSPIARLARWIYRPVLTPALYFPKVTLVGLGLLLVAAVVAVPLLREEYLPQFQENDFLMHWVSKPGTSIDFMRENIVSVSRDMRRDSPVAEFGSHIARAEIGEEVVGPNFAELWISLRPDAGDYTEARRKIEAVMARYPGFDYDLLTYLQERIKEVLSGAGASIVLRTYGPELSVLRQKAQQIRQAIEGSSGSGGAVAGVVDLKVEAQVLVPQLELVLDPYRIAAVGLTPGAVVDAVATLVNGTKVGEIHREQMIFDIVIWGHPDLRKSLPDLRRLEIDLPNAAGTVPLEALADLRLVNAPNTIRHDRASRCIDVTCNVRGRALGDVVRDIRDRIAPLQQEGYRTELLGEYQARQENQRQLLGVGGVALIGIAALFYLDFRSVRLTLLLLLTLPFALVGGVAAALLTGGVLSLGSLVGFITVLGIAARNGIMLLSHFRHLELEEGMTFGRELIRRGAEERIVPILMTALAAGLGLLPLALSGSKPGYEIEYPMAVVILGGLATSTLLNLLVLPVLYELFGRVPVEPAAE